MFKMLKYEIKNILEKDPAAKNWVEVILLYPFYPCYNII